MNKAFTEDSLIEQPAIELFHTLGWQTANCFHEFEQAGRSPLGRETKSEVVLIFRLRPVLQNLNPSLYL
jgi:type I restriction enzyme R subunit